MDPFMSFKQLVLDRMRYYARLTVTKEALASTNYERIVADDTARHIIFQFEAEILGKRTIKAHTVHYEHPTDAHSHILCALPERGLLRRFLTLLWGEPNIRHYKQTVNAVETVTFPEATRQFPESLGSKVVFSTVEPAASTATISRPRPSCPANAPQRRRLRHESPG